MKYHVMRTYLVRFRQELSADGETDALLLHRVKLEQRVGSAPGGSLVVLDAENEARQEHEPETVIDEVNNGDD